LGFAACVSEVLLLAARLLESPNQAGNAEHGAADVSYDACLLLHLLHQVKLENNSQGEQAKCL
jgi:hypothetical protein